MVTDGNIIKEARFFVKAYSKEFCQTYSDLCGSPFAECIKSALDGQLRIAEKLESLEKTYCDKTKLPIADSIDEQGRYEVKKSADARLRTFVILIYVRQVGRMVWKCRLRQSVPLPL